MPTPTELLLLAQEEEIFDLKARLHLLHAGLTSTVSDIVPAIDHRHGVINAINLITTLLELDEFTGHAPTLEDFRRSCEKDSSLPRELINRLIAASENQTKSAEETLERFKTTLRNVTKN